MADIQFEDNRIEVMGAIDDTTLAFLLEAAGEVESQAARNTRVYTGQTKGSWEHSVDESAKEAHVGSNHENAIWEEFGTGEYALEGDGRKSPWYYFDERTGKMVLTTGKRPTRALHNAFESSKDKIIKAAESQFKGLK